MMELVIFMRNLLEHVNIRVLFQPPASVVPGITAVVGIASENLHIRIPWTYFRVMLDSGEHMLETLPESIDVGSYSFSFEVFLLHNLVDQLSDMDLRRRYLTYAGGLLEERPHKELSLAFLAHSPSC